MPWAGRLHLPIQSFPMRLVSLFGISSHFLEIFVVMLPKSGPHVFKAGEQEEKQTSDRCGG